MSSPDLEDCVLLVSAGNQLSERSFLEELFRSKNQTLQSINHQGLNSHAFILDNKYYNADIRFVTLKDSKELTDRLADRIEVLGILFDLEQENCLAKIEEIYGKFNEDNLQEKILICKSGPEPERKNNDLLLAWCCKNKFELVDLGELKADDEDGDDLIPESVGFTRFVEILDTHSWSNLRFKDEQDGVVNTQAGSDLRSEIKQDNLVDNYFKQLSLEENGKEPEGVDEKKLTFEELFSQIREFKEKADQLTGDDKYNYAEKVAMAFLNSLDEDD